MRPLLFIAAVTIAAAPGIAQKTGVPEATSAGEPVSCLSLSQIRETRVRSDKVIDFVTTGGKVYRNELPHSCPGLSRDDGFIHKTSTNNYCSLDTVTVYDATSRMHGPTCGLGKFQPVTLVK